MRVFGQLLLAGVTVAATFTSAQTPPSSSADATRVIAAAREALGGEARLSAVKSFVATGRTRQIRGDNLVPIEFEILCELPDKYVRKDEIPAQESGPTSIGFNAGELIQQPAPPPPPAGREGTPGPTPAQQDAVRKARVDGIKQDFVRFTLGMFAASFSTYPVTFTYAGQAEAPQGKADVIDVKGASNFAVRLFVNSQTHLPIMVSWQAPSGPMRGMPGRGGGPPAPGGPATPGAAAPGATTPGGPPTGAPPTGAPPTGAPPTGATPPSATAPGATPTGPPASAPPASAPPTAGAPAPPAGTPPTRAGGPPAGAPPGAGAGPGGRGAGPGGPPVEYRIYFADYREVDGMQWPFRLRKATGADTTEETTFDRFRINTKIDPRKFEVRK
jgi:hypothetical protein